MTRHKDIWAEWCLWIAIALVGFHFTGEFDEELDVYKWGATGWPRVVLFGLGAGASLQLLLHLRTRRKRPTVPDLPDDLRPKFVQPRLLVVFALSLLFLYLIPMTGFYVTTPAYLLVLLWLLEVRSLKAILLTITIIMAVILLLFTRYLYVALPVGNWPGFYDANNWIVVTARAPLFGG